MTAETIERVGARELSKRLIRARLSDAARELFIADGIANTSIDDVAARAGVSSRTFYRYFDSKEDLALSWLDDTGPVFRARLSSRPDTEPVWQSLRHAFDPLFEPDGQQHVDEMLIALKLYDESPAFEARAQVRSFEWERLMARVVEDRIPSGPLREFTARLLAGCALKALDIAFTHWRSTPTASLEAALDAAFAAVTTYTDLTEPPKR